MKPANRASVSPLSLATPAPRPPPERPA